MAQSDHPIHAAFQYGGFGNQWNPPQKDTFLDLVEPCTVVEPQSPVYQPTFIHTSMGAHLEVLPGHRLQDSRAATPHHLKVQKHEDSHKSLRLGQEKE